MMLLIVTLQHTAIHCNTLPSQTARLGFELTADIKAFQNASAASGLYVGFTVGTLPPGLHLSTVRGKGIHKEADPAIMSLRWTPCAHDLGTHVLCMDAVNNRGLAATQRCLVIDVVPDEAPVLVVTQVDTGLVIADNSATSDLRMGLEYTFLIAAHDANPLDTLMLNSVSSLPPGATLSPLVHTTGIFLFLSGRFGGQLCLVSVHIYTRVCPLLAHYTCIHTNTHTHTCRARRDTSKSKAGVCSQAQPWRVSYPILPYLL